MNLNELIFSIGIAFALGCDAFAVGMAVGTRSPCQRACFRLWFHFGLFQFLMPVIGWAIGSSVYEYIKDVDHWIAFGLMFFIAARMFKESLSTEEEKDEEQSGNGDPTRGWSLVGLSVATSIDALGVGFGMGIARMNLLKPAIIIGVTAALMTYTGIVLGRRLSATFGKRVETFGAIVLFVIAFKLLYI
ncbi:MAG TPA: manganese efflux pump MntP family protein [Candidatus Rifleibacterium sp.]|nr:manganese efflux pump MntP family protein [Candidatus Rifleibacterium sp.]HPT44590.1 manganese efflux pump MntP family protein [Candidatus Rifleibacterium sp.]